MELIEDGGGLIMLTLAILLPFISARVLIPLLMQLDKKQRLSARPNDRSSHAVAVSNIGGVGIFVSALLGLAPTAGFFIDQNSLYLFLGFLFIFILGVKDDIFESGPYFKLGGQVAGSLIIVEGAGLKIVHLQGLFGIGDLPPAVSLAVTLLFILTVINSINFIDGIDGLAALLGITGFVFLGMLFYGLDQPLFYLASFALASALAGYLKYNFSLRDKVFMGDTGSLMIGAAFSVFIVKLFNAGDSGGGEAPVWLLGAATLPLFDFFRVFLIRLFNGKSPLRADRNHVHHVMVDHFRLTHRRAAVLLTGLSALFMTTGYLMSDLPAVVVSVAFIFLFTVYVFVLHRMQKFALRRAQSAVIADKPLGPELFTGSYSPVMDKRPRKKYA